MSDSTAPGHRYEQHRVRQQEQDMLTCREGRGTDRRKRLADTSVSTTPWAAPGSASSDQPKQLNMPTCKERFNRATGGARSTRISKSTCGAAQDADLRRAFQHTMGKIRVGKAPSQYADLRGALQQRHGQEQDRQGAREAPADAAQYADLRQAIPQRHGQDQNRQGTYRSSSPTCRPAMSVSAQHRQKK